MKLKPYIATLITCFLIGTSCSTISNIKGRVVPGSTKTEQKTTNKQGKKQRGKRNKASNSTHDRQTSAQKTVTRSFTGSDSVAVAKSIAGEWFFENVAGIKVEGDENRPSLTFDENISRFYASNGCNYFNGDYVIGGFNAMTFQNVISTTNICYDIPWADYITAMFNIASNIYITGRGSEEYLDIRDNKDRPLATLRRHRLERLNGLWCVEMINGRQLAVNDCPTIVIDLIEHSIHGNSGCNLFNGVIYQSPDVDSSVQFQDMSVTRTTCPNTATETALLVALEQVEHAVIENDDSASLTDGNKRELIKLKRMSTE